MDCDETAVGFSSLPYRRPPSVKTNGIRLAGLVMTTQNKRRRVAYILLLCILVIAIVISGLVFPTVYADIDVSSSYDKSNAYDDLKNSIIGGKEFTLSDYPQDDKGTPSVISFTEYCYSTVAEKQAYFGLYVYIYNPSEKSIDTASVRNKILLIMGSSEMFKKYNLVYLNHSTDKDCQKRFYKFRIELTYSEQQALFKQLKPTKRTYTIVGVELSYSGTVIDYGCAQTYTYSGYGKGCNPDSDDTDTLSCTVDGFDRYVNLDVKHTEYRVKGDYYNGEQSQLNSVYFRVPNKYFKEYGELTEIACEWWEYFTKPLLVSNDINIVNAINSLYGKKTMSLRPDNYYLFMVFWENIRSSWFGGTYRPFQWTSNRDYTDEWYSFDFLWNHTIDFSQEKTFNGYSAAFYSDDLKDIDNTLTGNVVLERLRSHSEKLGGEKVRDRYSKALFENYVQDGYDMGYNFKSIKKDDKMEVFWNRISTKSLWTKLFGILNVDTEYDELNAIITINDTDVSGTDAEIAHSLYINKNDVSSFKNEHSKAKQNDETLVLFRFSTTKYMCAPTAAASCAGSQINSGTSDGEILVNDCYYIFKDRAWNAYTVQETVYLDFDIISLTYTLDDVETVIPVVSSPIDIVGGLTPPLEDPLQESSRDIKKIVSLVLALIIGILIIWLLAKFGVLKYICKGIAFVVTAPFKLISKAIKRRKNKSNGSK